MAASTAPHPVSSTAEAPKPAEGLEPVTAGASATPAPAAAGKPGKEGKAGKPKKDKAAGGSSGPLELSPAPEYFDERIKIFDEYKKKYDAEVAGMCPTSARLTLGWRLAKPREAITITLPNGTEVQGTSWETTPLQVAKDIAQSLADKTIIAKVNNQELWDLDRPLEFSCSLKLLDFDSEDNDYEARQVFWHSSAHVLGEACERRYDGCCLGYGPPLPEGGFFYDMSLAEGRTLGPDDYKHVEDVAKMAVKEKQPFERLELPKEVLLEMFKVGLFSAQYRTPRWSL
jgi:threonyl-tRNA synthetase